MDMQDKEFDKLFSQKFQDLELEPSAAAWDNIYGKLNSKKQTRSLLPWLSIAATVLVVATAGVLFLSKNDKTDKPTKPTKLVVSRAKPVEQVKTKADHTEPALVKQAKAGKFVASISVQYNRSHTVASKIIPVDVTSADIVDHDPNINNPATIANLTGPSSTQSQPTLPDIQLTPQTLTNDAQQVDENQTAAPVKKRGIHNLGGLINAVVGKLDRRDNKIIEFSDGEEDDENVTTVTGVNLGLIRIKKQ
jgi:hypothetical protein